MYVCTSLSHLCCSSRKYISYTPFKRLWEDDMSLYRRILHSEVDCYGLAKAETESGNAQKAPVRKGVFISCGLLK